MLTAHDKVVIKIIETAPVQTGDVSTAERICIVLGVKESIARQYLEDLEDWGRITSLGNGIFAVVG